MKWRWLETFTLTKQWWFSAKCELLCEFKAGHSHGYIALCSQQDCCFQLNECWSCLANVSYDTPLHGKFALHLRQVIPRLIWLLFRQSLPTICNDCQQMRSWCNVQLTFIADKSIYVSTSLVRVWHWRRYQLLWANTWIDFEFHLVEDKSERVPLRSTSATLCLLLSLLYASITHNSITCAISATNFVVAFVSFRHPLFSILRLHISASYRNHEKVATTLAGWSNPIALKCSRRKCWERNTQ